MWKNSLMLIQFLWWFPLSTTPCCWAGVDQELTVFDRSPSGREMRTVLATRPIERGDRGLSIEDDQEQSSRRRQAAGSPKLDDQGLGNRDQQMTTEDQEADFSPEEKRELALSLLQGALGSAERLKPIEYRIRTQVEAASALWHIDRARARAIFERAFGTLHQWKAEIEKSEPNDRTSEARWRKLWSLVLRKMAAVNPELVEEFLRQAGELSKQKSARWTDEARAMMSVAWDQVEKDPALAAHLAEKSLRFGLADWTSFLQSLSRHDPTEAERLARVIIDWLRDGPFVSTHLLNFRRFVFGPGRSSDLQDAFLHALVVRLRRDARPDTPMRELQRDLDAARYMSQFTASLAPHWQAEFETLTSALVNVFKARAMPPPEPPPTRAIDVSSNRSSQPVPTSEILQALSQAEEIEDDHLRDETYQRLASRAARSENLGLAERIMSRIEDENIRRETSLKVYGPLVRKALREADYVQAQMYALKISHPLGRTLVLDLIAERMRRAKVNGERVGQVYDLAMAQLSGEATSEEVARAYLVLARSLAEIAPERSLEALGSAIVRMNQLAKKGALLWRSELPPAIRPWVRLPHYALNEDEVLDPIEMLEMTFRELTRYDARRALSLAPGLAHAGSQSLAQVAIARGLLDEGERAPASREP